MQQIEAIPATNRSSPVQNGSSSESRPPPTKPPEIPTPSSSGTLRVTTTVSGGNSRPSDFAITVSGNNPRPASFAGSSSSTTVTLRPGDYSVSAASVSGYRTTYSSGCSGSISGGQTVNCTVTNQYSLTSLNVITKVDNNNVGTKNPSDFTITVSGNNPSPRTFSGSSSGTSVTLRPGS
jgi:hypothetical protein